MLLLSCGRSSDLVSDMFSLCHPPTSWSINVSPNANPETLGLFLLDCTILLNLPWELGSDQLRNVLNKFMFLDTARRRLQKLRKKLLLMMMMMI